MSTVVNLRKLLDRKQWEPVTPLPFTTAAGTTILPTPPTWPRPMVFMSNGTSTHYLYHPLEDAYIELPGGTLGAHTGASTGVFHPYGPGGTASAGSSTTLTTTLTIPTDLSGYVVRITSGTGAGQERVISSNTLGANSVLTVATAWTTNPDNTSVYVIMSGRFWFLGATGAAVVWKYYDIATNAWTAKSTTSGPASNWGTDGNCTCTSSLGWAGSFDATTNKWNGSFDTGTATAGGAATLTDGGKSWTVNQWANMQVRILSGTGAGQIRTINSNTSTALTVSANWGTNPDATSVYVIEGNDDWIFVAGNNAVTLFRYAISGIAGLSANAQATGDTWITISPGVARAAAGAAGLSLDWIPNSTDARFTTASAIVNGRRLYSFRAGATATLDYYDIPSNAWTNGVAYGQSTVTFTTNTSWAHWKGQIYGHKEATGRFFKFDTAGNTLYPLSTLISAQGAGVLGNGKVFVMSYVDGGTEVTWLYSVKHTSTEVFRMLLI